MHFEPFEAGNIIKLRKGMGSFPLSSEIPDLLVKHNVIPLYLGDSHDGFVKEGEVLLVTEVFKDKDDKTYAYSCLTRDRTVYLVNMISDGIDPNICFIKCN